MCILTIFCSVLNDIMKHRQKITCNAPVLNSKYLIIKYLLLLLLLSNNIANVKCKTIRKCFVNTHAWTLPTQEKNHEIVEERKKMNKNDSKFYRWHAKKRQHRTAVAAAAAALFYLSNNIVEQQQ